MATWGVHIRIANELLTHFKELDREKFFIGNIGPDCGVLTDNGFEPSKKITHFYNENSKIDYEGFYNKYIYNKTYDIAVYSYLLGYYSHLITDYLYTTFYKSILKEQDVKALKQDKSLIIKIKEEWYDIDHKFHRDHKDCAFYKEFCLIKNFEEVLNFFEKDATIKQVNNIKDYYLNIEKNKTSDLDREYHYYTSDHATYFVNFAVESIIKCIEEKI